MGPPRECYQIEQNIQCFRGVSLLRLVSKGVEVDSTHLMSFVAASIDRVTTRVAPLCCVVQLGVNGFVLHTHTVATLGACPHLM